MSENHQPKHGYQPQVMEKSWQQYWDENKTFKTGEDPGKPKFYALDMFPYPSGSGSARRSPGRIYGNGYRFPLQTYARLQRTCIQWVGMLSVCLLSSTHWIRVSTHGTLHSVTSTTSVVRSSLWVSRMTGIVRSAQRTRTTTNGHNGSSFSLYKKGLGLCG